MELYTIYYFDNTDNSAIINVFELMIKIIESCLPYF